MLCTAIKTIYIICLNMSNNIKKNFAAKSKVRAACQNKSACKFKVDNGFFGRDPCHNTFKYFDIKYTCKVCTLIYQKYIE